MNREDYLNLIKEEFRFVIQLDEEAEEVYDILIREYESSNRKEDFDVFIIDSVCAFDSKEDAFEWFMGPSRNYLALLDELDTQNLEITEDMVGKDFSDALIDCYLDNAENCEKIHDTLYITWWM